MSKLRWLFAMLVAVVVMPTALHAQQGTTITGRVLDEAGGGLRGAAVSVPAMNIGTLTRQDGTFALIIPAGRFQAGQAVQMRAQQVGYQVQNVSVTLQPGTITQNFTLALDPLRLQEVVVTGAGTETRAVRLGTARAAVDSATIQRTAEPNMVAALSGRVSNVVTNAASGEAGASTAIRIRGTSTLSGTGQPLFVIDGVPMNNATRSSGSPLGGTVAPNRAFDINPDDIESIEILKGPAATSVFGAQAGAAGAILITTKRGQPGRTSYSLRSTLQFDQPTNLIPMQRTWDMGSSGSRPTCVPSESAALQNCFVGAGFFSWGPRIAAGTPTFDNVANAFGTGRIFDNTITVSGGSERTTFYLSGGSMNHQGFIAGDNDSYERYTVRLNGSHRMLDNLTVGGNVSYVQTQGRFVERGNSINGMVLGAVRTPATFDNRQFLSEEGLHRSYRFPNPSPTAFRLNRGFDNPHYAINAYPNTGEVGRVFGTINTTWTPLPWLRLSHNLGADYANDDRTEAVTEQASGAASGGVVTQWQFYDRILDHSLVATAEHSFSPMLSGSISVGQNLNDTFYREVLVTGRNLIAPVPFKLTNTVNRDTPRDNEFRDRIESYLFTGTLDIADQLFLTAGVTNFGSSRFGLDNQRAWYPRAQAAWSFTEAVQIPENILSFGKLRVAYGQSGQQPGIYLTEDVFTNALITDFNPGSQLRPTLGGVGGLYTTAGQGNPGIRPERVAEIEGGIDLAFLNGRADVALTSYRQTADDVIFAIPVPGSTGFLSRTLNAAEVENTGLEAVVNFRVLDAPNYGLTIGGNWARNRNMLVSLGDPNVTVAGFWQGTSFGGRTTNAVVGEPLGVFRGTDFARCGRGLTTLQGYNIAAACEGAPDGAMFLDSLGVPILDGTTRTIGDPNPDWMGGLNAELNLFGVRVTAFVEHRQGGTNQNMTRASMYQYGTHGDTEQRATCTAVNAQNPLRPGNFGGLNCEGNLRTFGQDIMPGAVVGPGAGRAVPIGENWWTGLGSIGGPAAQFQEDATFTRLREIGIAYSFTQPWVQRNLGFGAVDVRVAGRNLATWTNYTGFDPEVNTGGAAVGNRGIDWMVNPMSRAWLFTVGFNR